MTKEAFLQIKVIVIIVIQLQQKKVNYNYFLNFIFSILNVFIAILLFFNNMSLFSLSAKDNDNIFALL